MHCWVLSAKSLSLSVHPPALKPLVKCPAALDGLSNVISDNREDYCKSRGWSLGYEACEGSSL